MPKKNKLYKNTNIKTKNDILKPHNHREKGNLLSSTNPLLHLLNPFPSRAQRSSPSPSPSYCQLHIDSACIPTPPASVISCRLTITVSLLFPTWCREHGQRVGSFITATPVTPLRVSTSFSSKWPWNQLHNRGLWNPKQQGLRCWWIIAWNKIPLKPNSPAHFEAPGSFLQPSVRGVEWFRGAPTRGSFS